MNKNHSSMAILCTSQSLGGLELNLINLAEFLREKNFNISFLCATNSAISFELKKRGIPFLSLTRKHKYFDLKAVFKLKKFFKEFKYQYCIYSYVADLDLLYWMSPFKNPHADFKIIYYQQMQIGVSKKHLYHSLKHQKINYWIAPLPWLKNEALEKTSINAENIKVLPLCFNTFEYQRKLSHLDKMQCRYTLGIPEDALVIGIIGRIDPGKGQKLLLEAFLLLKNTMPKAHLIIVGSPTLNDQWASAYNKELRDYVYQCHLDQSVTFIPHLPFTGPALKAMDISVVCSLRETFGMVTIEALLTQTPTIGFASGGTIDLLGNGHLGKLFFHWDSQELYEALAETIEKIPYWKKILNQEHSKLLNEFSLERVEEFLSSLP
jgi:glycosyltransferase involved in cell wall biosynthesis